LRAGDQRLTKGVFQFHQRVPYFTFFSYSWSQMKYKRFFYLRYLLMPHVKAALKRKCAFKQRLSAFFQQAMPFG